MKTCPKCKEEKPKTEFHKNRQKKDGLDGHCKDCRKAYNKTPARRASMRKREQGRIAAGEYRDRRANQPSGTFVGLFEKQEGRCASCNIRLNNDKNAHLDHCHKTGAVRGILCHGCNVALGFVDHSIERLESLISYLESNESTITPSKLTETIR